VTLWARISIKINTKLNLFFSNDIFKIFYELNELDRKTVNILKYFMDNMKIQN